jgi:hypothetical protein
MKMMIKLVNDVPYKIKLNIILPKITVSGSYMKLGGEINAGGLVFCDKLLDF